MLEFRQKKKIRRILYSPFTLIFLLIILLILLKSLFGAYNKAKLSTSNLEKEKNELQRLINREKILSSSIDYLKTDAGIENEIRNKFRAIKEGERVAVIVDDNANSTSTSSLVSTSTSSGFFGKIFNWFR